MSRWSRRHAPWSGVSLSLAAPAVASARGARRVLFRARIARALSLVPNPGRGECPGWLSPLIPQGSLSFPARGGSAQGGSHSRFHRALPLVPSPGRECPRWLSRSALPGAALAARRARREPRSRRGRARRTTTTPRALDRPKCSLAVRTPRATGGGGVGAPVAVVLHHRGEDRDELAVLGGLELDHDARVEEADLEMTRRVRMDRLNHYE